MAVTLLLALIGTVQVGAVPEHPPPLQPVKVLPTAAAAVKVTGVLGATVMLAVVQPAPIDKKTLTVGVVG